MVAKKILKALYDIRPTKRNGELDIEKVSRIRPVIDLRDIILSTNSCDDDFLFGNYSSVADKNIKETKQLQARKEIVAMPKAEIQRLTASNKDPSRKEILAEILAIDEADEKLYRKHLSNRKEIPSKIVELPKARIVEAVVSEEHDLEEVQMKDLRNKFDEATLEKIKAFRDQVEKVQKSDMQAIGMFTPYQQITRDDDVVIGAASLVQLPKGWKKSMAVFAICAMLVSCSVPALAFFQKGMQKKDKILELSKEAYKSLNLAKESAESINLDEAGSNFQESYEKFAAASYEISDLGEGIVSILGKIPGLGVVKSGEHLLAVGQNISSAGRLIVKGISPFTQIKDGDYLKNVIGDGEGDLIFPENSLTDAIFQANANLKMSLDKLKRAQSELVMVDINDLPTEVRQSVLTLKEKLPVIIKGIEEFIVSSDIILEILGHYGPKKYLFIFQNPNEMRATGGFIGTYGVVDVNSGYVNKVFVDGIYNPDGQLRTLIVPPKPIQKISANWSTHDANWFADYPASARKISWFYEKTGGPTVDGVFAMTPFVIEKLLEITGPIEMSEYDIVITADNFVENVMYKVEVDYDKELNQPKKIIADLAPMLLNQVFNSDSSNWKEVIDIVLSGLRQKHILFYFFDVDVQDFVEAKNWDGRVLQTEGDYLSVINSNINGYKSDGMVEENITHQSEIQSDGSIIDTVVIHRQHLGGNEEYDWWNKVNSDYMRVFVPLGSELLEAKGHTKEAAYDPPVDYNDYMIDLDVAEIESSRVIDEKSGTHIFEEAGKTVFANWVYVSPGEEVVVTYKYKLPFKVDMAKGLDKYSLLVQKQSGSEGSGFIHQLEAPAGFDVVWSYPEDSSRRDVLDTDKLYGVVLESIR